HAFRFPSIPIYVPPALPLHTHPCIPVLSTPLARCCATTSPRPVTPIPIHTSSHLPCFASPCPFPACRPLICVP
ncbi:hypothetical protein B0H10DRAFT_2073843, partial [Mycena sp. CBHHK59/15]